MCSFKHFYYIKLVLNRSIILYVFSHWDMFLLSELCVKIDLLCYFLCHLIFRASETVTG